MPYFQSNHYIFIEISESVDRFKGNILSSSVLNHEFMHTKISMWLKYQCEKSNNEQLPEKR